MTPSGLAGARLYLVCGVRLAAGPLESLVSELADAGVDLVQLREKRFEARALLLAAGSIAEACRGAGVPFIVNDRPDVALLVDADGVHLGQDDLPLEAARRLVGDRWVGGSTHSEAQIDDAVGEGWDYFGVGPIFETPTKPGRAAVGLDLIAHAAAHAGHVPWFAIGGIDHLNVTRVLGAGARRIVVVRAIADAPDPVAATARLRRLLDEVPL